MHGAKLLGLTANHAAHVIVTYQLTHHCVLCIVVWSNLHRFTKPCV